MIRIVDNDKLNVGTKMFETQTDYYVNTIEYNKENMLHTPFKSFDDGNILNNILFHQTLNPYVNNKYYNGLKVNNTLMDSSDNQYQYISQYSNQTNDSFNTNYAKISVLHRNKNIKTMSTYLQSKGNTLNNNIIKFLGQSDTHIYIVIVGSKQGGYYGSDKPDQYYNTSLGNGGLESELVAIKKTDIYQYKESSPIQPYNFQSTITTFPRSYGNVKVIKDTKNEMYCIVSIFDDSGNQYEIFKINKDDNTYSSIEKFKQEYDEQQRGDIVTPSDVKEINDDTYEFYLTLMEKGEQVSEENYYHRKYYLYKCEFTISTNNLKKTKMILNDDDLPFFGYNVGKYYNEIYFFEKDNSKYLVTSTNIFNMGTKKFEQTDNIISYYKINDSDTPSLTLLQRIKASDLVGEFYGMLFNKDEYTFLAITSETSYLISFEAETIQIINTFNKPQEIGIDLQGNYFASNRDSSVYIYGKKRLTNIILTAPDIPDEVTYPYKTNVKVSALNYKGERITIPIRMIAIGDNITFDDSSTNIAIINSSESGDTNVAITVTGDSLFEINAQVERDDII